jgi:hypothetical protein
MARNYDCNGDPCGEFGTALREVNKLQDEIARLRLTDEEREAISAAACICEDAGRTDIAVIIHTALERLG